MWNYRFVYETSCPVEPLIVHVAGDALDLVAAEREARRTFAGDGARLVRCRCSRMKEE